MGMRRLSLSFTVLAGLACGLAGGAVAAQQGPGGDAFYVPPSPLPEGPRGSLVWARGLMGTMAAAQRRP